MSLKSIEEGIKKYVPNAVMEVVYNEKLNRPLLFVATRPNIRTLAVYDESRGFKEVAKIRYNLNGNSVYISSFVVDVDYQGCGIGKTIFNFAMAHLDAMGGTRLYGTASPTDPIKGVSTDSDESYENEVRTLKTIYEKLGCRFIDDENFVQDWEHGDKINEIDPSLRKMIGEWVKRDTKIM